jgi:hypothetical protein
MPIALLRTAPRRLLETRGVSLLIEWSTPFLGAEEFAQLGGADEAAHVGGEDAIDAALHLLSCGERSVPKPACCLGIPDPKLGRRRVLGGRAREHQANILAAVCPH